MSEYEGEEEWIANPRENVCGCVGKGILFSSGGYHLPLLAQLLLSRLCYVFPPVSVGEQFLRNFTWK